MDSVFVMKNGDDPPDRWRLTARTIMEFRTAESQTALGRVFTRWPLHHWIEQDTEGRHPRHMRRLLPVGSAYSEVVRIYTYSRSVIPCELRLEQLMAVHA